ncbi:MAG: hypothetical protein ACRDGM_01310 [bacterium]
MKSRMILLRVALAGVLAVGLLISTDRTEAQPAAQMMSPGQQMPIGQMMGMMQQQMNQMNTNLRAMRAQLGKVNPDLLTGQERPLYEYLKLLQGQLETMHGWMGNAQNGMRQMPGMGR